MRVRWLPVALLLLPVIEIAVIIQVGQQIGASWTVALLLGMSLLGAWIIKREGRRAWLDLQRSVDNGQQPDREMVDSALILLGGLLLLIPGFVTDVLGILLVLPFTRPFVRRAAQAWLAKRATTYVVGRTGRLGGPQRPVVPGEVVDD
jgi:UPF0716 protein FxsA